MNIVKTARLSPRARLRVIAVIGAALCALTAGVGTAEPASADSRQFTVTNTSSRTLRLEGVHPTEFVGRDNERGTRTCAHREGYCGRGDYQFRFEGRAQAGDELAPGGIQRFDLSWEFGSIWDYSDDISYAAQLTYKIEGTNAKLKVWIDTTRYANTSRCEIESPFEWLPTLPGEPRDLHRPYVGSCTAGGLGITFQP